MDNTSAVSTSRSRDIKYILVIILLISAGVAMYFVKDNQARVARLQAKTATDVNKQYLNEKGQLVSEKMVLSGSLKDAKAQVGLLIKQGDTIQSRLSSTTRQVISLRQQISISKSGVPDTVKIDVPVFVDKIKIDSPTLSFSVSDEYHSLRVAGNLKKYAYTMGVNVKTELVTDDLGKNGTKVTVLNKNPYIVSSEANSIIIPQKKSSPVVKWLFFALGLGAGYVAFK